MTKKLSPSAKRINERYRLIIDQYLTNGRNQTRAMIAAGYSPHTAQQMSTKVFRRPKFREMLDLREAKLPQITGLSAERTLLEIARVAFFDPRSMYREDGSLKPIHEMDADTRAAIASIDIDALNTKIKTHSKTAALEQAAKHLGLYEKDNTQRSPNLNLQIVLVEPKAREPKDITPGGGIV